MATIPGWLRELFATIDARDAAGFASFLAPDARFVFANAPAVEGHGAVEHAVAGFFDSVAGLRHRLDAVYDHGATVVCEGSVTYTRHDGSTLTVPFCNVFDGVAGGKVRGYRIYGDMSALYAA